MFYKIIRFLLYLPIKILYPTKFINLENLPKNRAILVCNHFTLVDILILIVLIKRPLYTWAKKELFKNNFMAWCYKSMRGIPVDRINTGLSTIKKSIEVLQNEKLLCIFPEGTRNNTNQEKIKIKNGVILVALKAKSPIIPSIFIKKPKIFTQNYLIIGQPVSLDKFYNGENNKKILSDAGKCLSEKMEELRNNFFKNS
ncbi:MAG: lysophospholipid acyltransferase family protein [Clostridia bacterium]|jgi:1-acyl-sn-glycerol-3-phosphate acyltransferase|nr:1-acyl-sn-glycerol-3-phosphate acyltransferase [Clostridia bacterium]